MQKTRRHYMIVQDGRGRIRKLWGGYSPKIYDSSFLEIAKNEIIEDLKGGVIIADGHFTTGPTTIPEIEWITPKRIKKQKIEGGNDVIRDPNATSRSEHYADIAVLTCKAETQNVAIHKHRARVETPFGVEKWEFEALQKPWAEDLEQLDCTVEFAFGVWKVKRK
eukprot:TRINITY_DN4337_c0_g2_i1.p1 TRINITY_DN4337_c0_g2~~TRINITY_DN4337_c0_g2_i1.p1  ORF type:complete len:165 (+),score=32.84 TRINITY_DN4337_c0_g2_i1:481-975(+)